MLGMLLWKEPVVGQRRITLKEENCLHMRILQAEIARGEKTPETILHRRILAAEKKLARKGVERVILPAYFPFSQTLSKFGLRPVSTLPLRKCLAADWVRAALEEKGIAPGSARVAVCADHLTADVVRTITELSLRHRYVMVAVPYGGEELCRRLRREYGVSLLMNPSSEQLEQAEAKILFDPAKQESGNPVVLPLYDENWPLPQLLLPPALERQISEQVNRGQMLTVLQQSGVVRPGQITLGRAGSDESREMDGGKKQRESSR